jgi:hypothetical protein
MLEKLQKDPSISKTNYEQVLNNSKHSKNSTKIPEKFLNCARPCLLRQDLSTTPKNLELLQNLLKRPFCPCKLPKLISFDPELRSAWFLCPNSLNSSPFLFLHSYITNYLLHCIYFLSIVCLALGNSMLEPLFKDFQEQVFKEYEVFFSGQQGKCPWSLCIYCVPIYYVVCRKCMIGVSLHTPMLETTRTLIDYSLETL